MIQVLIGNMVRFIFLLLLQGLVINSNALNLGAWFMPYVYVYFMLALPFETPKWLIIPLAFVYGMLMDTFTNTMGLHASTMVFVAFMQPRIQKLLSPREGYPAGSSPSVQDMGFNWFMYYAGIMVLIHHTTFFLLEVFRFSDLHLTLLKTILSSALTLALLVLGQFLTIRPGNR
jgi:rod shape-determining protein MreD